jgi:hypothetical protein
MRGAPAGRRDAGPAHSPIDDDRDGVVRSKGPERSTTADEHAITVRLWPALLQIGDESIADFLSQRQTRLPAALPTHMDPRILPADITETQLNDISRAEP